MKYILKEVDCYSELFPHLSNGISYTCLAHLQELWWSAWNSEQITLPTNRYAGEQQETDRIQESGDLGVSFDSDTNTTSNKNLSKLLTLLDLSILNCKIYM